MKKKLALWWTMMLHQKMRLAAVITGGSGAVAAGATGSDPLVWFFGGVGAAWVYVKLKAAPREQIVNAIISVMLAVWLSDPVARILEAKLTVPHVTHENLLYPVALLLAMIWPWVISIGSKKMKELG